MAVASQAMQQVKAAGWDEGGYIIEPPSLVFHCLTWIFFFSY